MYKLHKFRTFCTYTKTCFFSRQYSSRKYRTRYYFSLLAMIFPIALFNWNVFNCAFLFVYNQYFFFEIDIFTPDTSTLFPFSIYFLLFIKQQNTMVEICNNIVQKHFGKNFIHAIILKRRR